MSYLEHQDIPTWKPGMKFKDMGAKFELRTDHEKKEIILKYDKKILDYRKIVDGRTIYEYSLDYIKKRIDECIRKSYA